MTPRPLLPMGTVGKRGLDIDAVTYSPFTVH